MNVLEARRRLLGRNVYKRTTEGNPAIAQGSLARRYQGVTMQGWTEQDSTTGAQLFDKNSTVTGLLNANGSIIQLDGYSTGDYIEVIEGQSYYCTKTGSSRGKYYNSNKEPIQITNYEDFSFYNGTYITIPQGVSYIRFSLADSNIDTIMLNVGTTSLPYEPYTGGAPSPSPDYPQPITSAGKYNEDTQKWEFEITIANEQTDPDKNQTVTLTSDRTLTKWDRLEKRNGQWGWVYKSAEIESYTDESVPGEYYSTTGQLSVSAQVWYETTTETFAPLSESEQEAMNALHTYRPTTVLSNQQGCQMALTYKTRKGVGGNLLDLDDPSFILTNCIYVSKYSVKCNIVDYYFSSISNYNLNDLIKRNIGKNIIFSCDGNPEGKIIGIVLYGSYLDGSTSKEINTTTGKEIKLNIEDATEFTRIELRFNRSSEKFTDTETIISNLSLKIE